jgi:hypothetical protein
LIVPGDGLEIYGGQRPLLRIYLYIYAVLFPDSQLLFWLCHKSCISISKKKKVEENSMYLWKQNVLVKTRHRDNLHNVAVLPNNFNVMCVSYSWVHFAYYNKFCTLHKNMETTFLLAAELALSSSNGDQTRIRCKALSSSIGDQTRIRCKWSVIWYIDSTTSYVLEFQEKENISDILLSVNINVTMKIFFVRIVCLLNL